MGSKKKGPSFDKQRNTLLSQVKGDQTIDEVTRQELLGKIGSIEKRATETHDNVINGQKTTFTQLDKKKRDTFLTDVTKTFEKAKQGEGVFGYRQQRRDTILSRTDRPGLGNQLG